MRSYLVSLFSLTLVAQLPAQLQWRLIATAQPFSGWPAAVSTSPVALADLDGDGFAEVLAGAPLKFAWSIQPYWGTSGYQPIESPSSTAAVANRVVTADVDGDGDLDVLLLRGFGTTSDPSFTNSLYINQGVPHFVEETGQRWPTGPYATMDAAVVDFDGDSLLDILECNLYGQNRLFLGQTGGTFVDVTATHMPVSVGGEAVAVGDIDGDGSLDAVIAAGRYTGRDHVLLNDGLGHFTDASARLAGRATDAAVALGDVDGDGDLDLACAVYSGTGQSELLRNDGAGNFTPDPAAIPAGPCNDYHTRVEFVDLDADGDLDLLFGYGSVGLGCGRFLFLNDGAGHFALLPYGSTLLEIGTNQFSRFSTADMDADGDVDLVGASEGTWPWSSKILYGMDRQLSGPAHLYRGHGYDLEFDGAVGAPAILGVSWDYLSTPLPPYGVLHLDPAAYVIWNALVMLDATGHGSLAVSIPVDPILDHLKVCLQGLTYHRRTAALTLTNAITYTIL